MAHHQAGQGRVGGAPPARHRPPEPRCTSSLVPSAPPQSSSSPTTQQATQVSGRAAFRRFDGDVRRCALRPLQHPFVTGTSQKHYIAETALHVTRPRSPVQWPPEPLRIVLERGGNALRWIAPSPSPSSPGSAAACAGSRTCPRFSPAHDATSQHWLHVNKTQVPQGAPPGLKRSHHLSVRTVPLLLQERMKTRRSPKITRGPNQIWTRASSRGRCSLYKDNTSKIAASQLLRVAHHLCLCGSHVQPSLYA